MTIKLAAAAAALAVLAGPAWGAGFDARTPADVLGVLTTNGASGEMAHDGDGPAYISAKAGKLAFDAHFSHCNDAHSACEVVVYQIGFNSELVNVDQINRWNQWAVLCPAYLTAEKHPHTWMGARLSASLTRADVAAQQQDWLTCLDDFDRFTDDPEAFLKAHQ